MSKTKKAGKTSKEKVEYKYECPDCGSELKYWHEASSPDDYRWVGYCKECKQLIEE